MILLETLSRLRTGGQKKRTNNDLQNTTQKKRLNNMNPQSKRMRKGSHCDYDKRNISMFLYLSFTCAE